MHVVRSTSRLALSFTSRGGGVRQLSAFSTARQSETQNALLLGFGVLTGAAATLALLEEKQGHPAECETKSVFSLAEEISDRLSVIEAAITAKAALAAPLKLSYFPIPALGEPARAILALSDLEWTDDRPTFAEWRAPGRREETKWGQLPTLVVSGQMIAQSRTIGRYLGKLVCVEGKPLYPEDPLKAALVDDVLDIFADAHTHMAKTFAIKDQAEKEAARQAVVGADGGVGKVLGMLEVAAESGGNYVGGATTLADIWIYWYLNFLVSGFWDGLEGRTDLVLEPYPKLGAIVAKVASQPKLQVYYAGLARDNAQYKCYAGLA